MFRKDLRLPLKIFSILLLLCSSAFADETYLSSDSVIDTRSAVYNNILNPAVAAAGANVTSIWITKIVTLSSPLTVPANVTLVFFGAGKIDCQAASSTVLTGHGPIEAGDRNIFDNCPAAALSFTGNTAQRLFRTSWFDSSGIATAVLPSGAMLDAGVIKSTLSNSYTPGAKQIFTASATTAGANIGPVTGQPSAPVSGDLINNNGTWQTYTSSWKTFAFTDSNITGNAATATAWAATPTPCGTSFWVKGVAANGTLTCTQPSAEDIFGLSTTYVKKGSSNTYAGSTTQDFSAGSIKLPVSNAPTPTTDGAIAVNSTSHTIKVGLNGTTKTLQTTDASVALATTLVPNAILNTPSIGVTPLTNTYIGGTGGTTAATLVKLDASGNVVTASASDVGIIGIAMSTVSAAASVEVATRGKTTCIADNTTIIGNVLIPGTSTGGRCRDSGLSNNTLVANTVQVVGKALTVATVGNPVTLQLFGPGHYGAAPKVAPIGSGTATGSFNVVYDKQVSAAGVGNGADTTDDPLFTIPTIPANTLDLNGDQILVRGEISTAANANTKAIGVLFQAVQVTTATCVCNNAKMIYEARITRVDATHVNIFMFGTVSGGNFIAGSVVNQAVSDLSSATSILKVTGSSPVTGAASDVLGYGSITTITQ